MPQKVLNDDWSDYDDLKKKRGDANFFACDESWERDYLKKKIRRLYPQFSEAAIEAAIAACCLEVRPPRPRKTFVECVLRRLRS